MAEPNSGPDMFDRMIKFIKEVGFPIGVAIWLLYQADVNIRALTAAVTNLNLTMAEIVREIRSK